MSKIYKFDDEIGLKVLGFKPRSVLKPSHNITHSSFVYPDETVSKKAEVFMISSFRLSGVLQHFHVY